MKGARKSWWEEQLPEVERFLRADLHRRMAASEHDDIVSATLVGLVEWMKRKESFPASWVKGEPTEEERATFFKLARVIMRRRVADRYRFDARKLQALALAEAAAAAPSPDRDRTILMVQMLAVAVVAISLLSREDRDLLAVEGSLKRGTLTPRERQRVHRARAKIGEKIRDELGVSPDELLSRRKKP